MDRDIVDVDADAGFAQRLEHPTPVAFDLDGLERLETRQSTDVDVGDFFLLELAGVLITFIAALVLVGTAAS